MHKICGFGCRGRRPRRTVANGIMSVDHGAMRVCGCEGMIFGTPRAASPNTTEIKCQKVESDSPFGNVLFTLFRFFDFTRISLVVTDSVGASFTFAKLIFKFVKHERLQ